MGLSKARQRQDRECKDKVVQDLAQPHERRKNLFCIARSMGLGTGEQWRKLDYIAHNNPELSEQIGSPGLTVNKAYGIAKQLEKRKNLLKMIPAEGTDGSAIIRYGFFERPSNVYWK